MGNWSCSQYISPPVSPFSLLVLPLVSVFYLDPYNSSTAKALLHLWDPGLTLPTSWHIHPVFNESTLHPYRPPKFASQEKELPPPPMLVGGALEYEVETILDSRLCHGKLEYLVKWEGYPSEDNTWEPEGNLTNALPFIQEFHKKHPSAPRHLGVQLSFVSIPSPLTDVAVSPLNWWEGKFCGKNSHVDMTQKGGNVTNVTV